MEAAVEDQPGRAFCSHVPVDWNVQQTAEGDGGTLHLNNKNTEYHSKTAVTKKHGDNKKKQAKS